MAHESGEERTAIAVKAKTAGSFCIFIKLTVPGIVLEICVFERIKLRATHGKRRHRQQCQKNLLHRTPSVTLQQ